jgi:hypothetical protein
VAPTVRESRPVEYRALFCYGDKRTRGIREAQRDEARSSSTRHLFGFFPPHFLRLLVLAQSHEHRMPQQPVVRPSERNFYDFVGGASIIRWYMVTGHANAPGSSCKTLPNSSDAVPLVHFNEIVGANTTPIPTR